MNDPVTQINNIQQKYMSTFEKNASGFSKNDEIKAL